MDSRSLRQASLCVSLLLVSTLRLGRALVCLHCDGVSHPNVCTRVTNCYTGEKCGIQTYAADFGRLLYRLGCVNENTCALSSAAICQYCCDDHDLCNAHGCNSTGLPTQRGPLCYNCGAYFAGYQCQTIEHCEIHQMCYNDASLEFQTDTVYSSGCRSKHACVDTHTAPVALIGRRTVSKDNAMVKRTTQLCTSCCQGDLCNTQCQKTEICDDDPTCQQLMPNFDVCKSPDIAEKFCKKSCNMCPDPTRCTDLRLDCSYIHGETPDICITKQQATTYGCLDFCGYCPGSTGPPSTLPTSVVLTLPTSMVLTTGHTHATPTTTQNTSPTTMHTPTPTSTTTTTTTQNTSPTNTSIITNKTTTTTTQSTSPTTIHTPPTTTTSTATSTTTTTTPNTSSTTTPTSTPITTATNTQTTTPTTTPTATSTTTTTTTQNTSPTIAPTITPITTTTTTQTTSPTTIHTPQTTTTPTAKSTTSKTTPNTSPTAEPTITPTTTTTTSSTTTEGLLETTTNPSTVPPLHIGDHVVRGQDWQGEGQDGHGTGIVTVLNLPPGFVLIRWYTTNITGSYRFGADGKFDVQLYNGPVLTAASSTTTLRQTLTTTTATATTSTTTPKPVETTTVITSTTTPPPTYGPALAQMLYIGARVQRGTDWKWGSQDGRGPGTITALPPTTPSGWAKVDWDTGVTNTYRMGDENAYDLMFVPGVRFNKQLTQGF